MGRESGTIEHTRHMTEKGKAQKAKKKRCNTYLIITQVVNPHEG